MDEEELKEIEQPTDLEDSFKHLDKILKDNSELKNIAEDKVLGMAHFGLGMWLRNNWYLWWSKKLAEEFKEKNYPQDKPLLVKMFNDDMNIHHADDMSSIIILSYHRHLNNKPLELEKQIKRYHDFWLKNKH